MILKLIWERYIFKEAFKVFILFLASLYFLYAIIDYSMHMQEIIKNQKISLFNLAIYYIVLFSKRLDLLLPLALLIATLKVLLSLNRKNELIAFQSIGISLKKLMRPFFYLALLCLSLTYLNYEYAIPNALPFLYRFEKQHFKNNRPGKIRKKSISVLPLEDGSRLIYQENDHHKNELFDVYWLLSSNELWHMQQLSLFEKIPVGKHVDHIYRSEAGLMEKADSYDTLSFPSLKLDLELKYYLNKPMENRPISELASMLKRPKSFFQERKDIICSHLYYKLLLPWLSLFVVIGAAPYATYFSRKLSPFLVFAVAIFGYIAFFTILDASVIIGEAHVVPPVFALFTIPFLALFFFGKKFLKMG